MLFEPDASMKHDVWCAVTFLQATAVHAFISFNGFMDYRLISNLIP